MAKKWDGLKIAGAAAVVLVLSVNAAFAFKTSVTNRPGYIVQCGQCGNALPPDGNDFIQVGGGRLYSAALRYDGSLEVWGYDAFGQVSRKPAGNNFTEVHVGMYHVVARKSDGTLVGWGQYELGGDVADSIPTGNDYRMVECGSGKLWCTLNADTGIECYGPNGDGHPTDTGYISLVVGNKMAYALKANGFVAGWGDNRHNQIDHLNSDANTRMSRDPWFEPPNWAIDTPRKVVKLSSGRYHFMFQRQDGTMADGGRPGEGIGWPLGCSGSVPNCYLFDWWQWPQNISLPLDTNPVTNPLIGGWVELADGGHHSAALRNPNPGVEKNQLYIWSQTGFNEVDDDPMPGYKGRPDIGADEEYVALASGYYHTLAIVAKDNTVLPRPTVYAYATDGVSKETDLSTGKFAVGRSGLIDSPLTVSFNITGTAIEGVDYTLNPSGHQITIPAGQYLAYITLTPKNDSIYERGEYVVLTPVNNSSHNTGIPTDATIVIEDKQFVPPTVNLTTVVSASEGGAAGSFAAERSGGTGSPEALPSPADLDSDGDVDNRDLGIFVDCWLNLAGPGCGKANFDLDSDVDFADFAAFSFEWLRSGGVEPPLTVYYSVSGTAVPSSDPNSANHDYIALSGQAVIPSGSSFVTVPIVTVNNSIPELTENITVTLQPDGSPPGGVPIYYKVGSNTQRTVSILDDEPKRSTVSISASAATVTEEGQTKTFTVTRTTDGEGGVYGYGAALTVYYNIITETLTCDEGDEEVDLPPDYDLYGYATNGTDYTLLSGSVVIPANQASASITLAPTADTKIEEDEPVLIEIKPNDLTYITDTLQDEATITILDNDWDTGWQRLSYDTFEMGWGSWTADPSTKDATLQSDNIPPCRTKGYNAPSGRNSAAIWDDQVVWRDSALPESMIFTSFGLSNPSMPKSHIGFDLDAPGYNQAKIDFKFRTEALNASTPDKFYLLFYNGIGEDPTIPRYVSGGNCTGWHVVKAYIAGVDFTNDSSDPPQNIYSSSVIIEEGDPCQGKFAFTSNVLFGLLSFVESDGQLTYLDDIKISARIITVPTVTITATDPAAAEQGTNTGTFTVTRTNNFNYNLPLTVNYTISGTATNGADYTSIGTSVTIAANQPSAAITITPINDTATENTFEDVTITLAANAAYEIGTPSAATVNIEDDDWAPSGWTGISFDSFETGWGNYTSGGACATIDCTSGYATAGSCAANICDNLGVSSSFATTTAFSLTGYMQAKVVFDYKSGSDIRGSDDFFVEFSSDGGTTWSTAQSYLGTIDFTANNTKLDQEVLLVKGIQSFTANCKIRFKADTDQVSRDIFIDKVRIMASTQLATYTMFSDGFETDTIAAGIWTTDSTSNVGRSGTKYTGSYGAKITKTSWLQKAISTAGTNNIHLKYVRKNGLDSSEASYVEWSTDGTIWNIVDTVAYNENWAVKDITCTSGANNNAGFRFRFRCNSTNGDGDQMSVDDVSVVGTQMP